MLKKFETRSSRVKGLCFHPDRPWILAGLHNGVVQIWDYRMQTMIDRFEEHELAVRGVCFHPDQPLFASGGDDQKVKVWNYKLRRCLFTLKGHMDYIRTVQFHHEQPWILSASDDQTIRISNWQSRQCISVLTGHNHYVMCAQFHPREDLVVSASLDVTIRVWDISKVRARKSDSSITQDLLGSNDWDVKAILDGHEKGVNWASFHPTKPLVVSGADDRTVRIWRVDDTRGYEIESLRGHTYNVSCCMFFKDYIVSNSEDKTVRVWDQQLRKAVHIMKRDTDRFWILAAKPEANLLAAGHDNGMVVFKLERERPAMTIHNNMLYYIRDRNLKTYDFESKQEQAPMTLRRHDYPPQTLSCNPADNMAAVWYDYDGGIFELFTIPKPGALADADIKKGFYTSAVFFSANKFAVLDKTRQVVLRNTSNDITKVLPAINDSDRLFAAPSGMILARNEDKVHLFHIAQRAVVAEVAASKVKYAIWDRDFNKVALQSKTSVTVCSRKLKVITTINEARVKSCCFDQERDVLYYTTANHLKYCSLRSGESGTIQTLDQPIYLVRANGETLWYITREGKVVEAAVDNTELNFKNALQQERYRDVLKLVQSKKLQGQSLVAYLHKHGHPEIAMHFVADPVVRFNLAVDSGAMDIAKASATEINTPECWRRLAERATFYGDIQLAQLANAKVQNMHGLGMQCIYTGNTPALSQVIAKSSDENFQMQFSLVTGETEKRIENLCRAGQLPLAYTLAKSNGLDEVCEQLLERMEPEVAARVQQVPVRPAPPVKEVELQPDNWPMLPVQESLFTRMLKEPGLLDYQPDDAEAGGKGAWDDEDDLDFGDGEANAEDDDELQIGSTEPKGDWDEDDLDIDPDMMPVEPVAAAGAGFVVPREGDSLQKHWVDCSQIAAHHFAAGSFASGLQLLKRQIGLVDGTPLQPHALGLWATCNASLPTWSALPSQPFALATQPSGHEMRAKHAPLLPKTLPALHERVKSGYEAVTEARFGDALSIFQGILYQVLFTETEDEKQLNELREIIAAAREYIQFINTEVERKAATEAKNQKRAIELSCYFTHYKLQTTHLMLALNRATTVTFNSKNLKTAAAIARRTLDLDPPKERADKARKVLAIAGDSPADAVAIDYDERNPFTLCTVSLTPMYRGSVNPIRCSYCHAAARPEYEGKKCPVCKIAAFGAFASGMVTGTWQSK